jgi:hypothetical protein
MHTGGAAAVQSTTVHVPEQKRGCTGSLKGKMNRACGALNNASKEAAAATKRAAQIVKLKHEIADCNKNILSIKKEFGEKLYPLLDVNATETAMARFREAKARIVQQQDAILLKEQELNALEHRNVKK